MTTASLTKTEKQPNGETGAPRIVVGVDGSEHSLHALRWAIERARATGERVQPVYVFDSMPPLDLGFAGLAAAGRISTEVLSEAALVVVRNSLTLAEAEDSGVQIDPATVDAHSEAIALLSAASGASMLVLGQHRRHWLDGVIGSTVSACLRKAPCAVVVVPAPTAA